MTRHVTIADCLPAVAFGEDGRIDDWRLKRTPATRRLQIHRDLDIVQFARKSDATAGRTPKAWAKQVNISHRFRTKCRGSARASSHRCWADAFAQTASTLQHFNGSPGRADYG